MEEEKVKEESNDSQHVLIHLSQISLIPGDIISIHWYVTQPFSGKKMTKIRTRWEVFILDSESVNYQDDCETLERVTARGKYQFD